MHAHVHAHVHNVGKLKCYIVNILVLKYHLIKSVENVITFSL